MNQLLQTLFNAICPMFRSYDVIKFVPMIDLGGKKVEADVVYSAILREV